MGTFNRPDTSNAPSMEIDLLPIDITDGNGVLMGTIHAAGQLCGKCNDPVWTDCDPDKYAFRLRFSGYGYRLSNGLSKVGTPTPTIFMHIGCMYAMMGIANPILAKLAGKLGQTMAVRVLPTNTEKSAELRM